MSDANVEYPEGFPVDEVPASRTLVEVEDFDIPGSTHPHWLLIMRAELTDEQSERIRNETERAVKLNGVFIDQIREARPDDEALQARAAELEAATRENYQIAESGVAYEIVAFCNRGGPGLLTAKATLTSAQEHVLKMQQQAEAKRDDWGPGANPAQA